MADESIVFSFDSLDAFQDPAGWSVASSVKGDPNEKRWSSYEEGVGVLVNGREGKAGNLVTTLQHGDVEAVIEFMIPKKSNSGIYFQGRYEVQILDSHGKPDKEISVHDCGAIYERWDEKREPKGYEGSIPATNASAAPGEWQRFHIIFRAPRFDESGNKIENARFVKVTHNGEVIHENAEVTGPTRGGTSKEAALGPIKIQGDHGPVAFRRIEIKPLDLED